MRRVPSVDRGESDCVNWISMFQGFLGGAGGQEQEQEGEDKNAEGEKREGEEGKGSGEGKTGRKKQVGE